MNNNKIKNVLIISFFFPPYNTSASIRIGKFAKYLPEFGWKPIILTVDKIKNLPATLPLETDETNVVRLPYFSLADMVAQKFGRNKEPTSDNHNLSNNKSNPLWRKKIFDAMHIMEPASTLPIINKLYFDPIGWRNHAAKKCLEIVKENNISVLFSSYSPTTSHIIASYVHRKTGIPWIADFRDPWSLNPYSKKTQPFHFLEKQWEKRTLRSSDLIITVSGIIARDLERLHSKEVITILNGFDDDDYKKDIPLLRKFTITYTGFIYPERDPNPIFRAIAELRDEGNVSKEDFELRFFGENVNDTISPLIKSYNLYDFVKVSGFIPFKKSIIAQKESSALLLLSWNNPKDKGTLTAKIFEYLGAKRPILALAYKGGAIDNLLRESGSGMIANEVEQIKHIIMKWLNEFKKQGKISSYYHPEDKVIKQYTRKLQAKKLAEIFDRAIIK